MERKNRRGKSTRSFSYMLRPRYLNGDVQEASECQVGDNNSRYKFRNLHCKSSIKYTGVYEIIHRQPPLQCFKKTTKHIFGASTQCKLSRQPSPCYVLRLLGSGPPVLSIWNPFNEILNSCTDYFPQTQEEWILEISWSATEASYFVNFPSPATSLQIARSNTFFRQRRIHYRRENTTEKMRTRI